MDMVGHAWDMIGSAADMVGRAGSHFLGIEKTCKKIGSHPFCMNY